MSNRLICEVILIEKTKTLTPSQLKERFLEETNSRENEDMLVELRIEKNKVIGLFEPYLPFNNLKTDNNIIWQVISRDITKDLGFSFDIFDSRKGTKYISEPPISKGACKAIRTPYLPIYQECLDFLEEFKKRPYSEEIPVFPSCFKTLYDLRYESIKYKSRWYPSEYLDIDLNIGNTQYWEERLIKLEPNTKCVVNKTTYIPFVCKTEEDKFEINKSYKSIKQEGANIPF